MRFAMLRCCQCQPHATPLIFHYFAATILRRHFDAFADERHDCYAAMLYAAMASHMVRHDDI